MNVKNTIEWQLDIINLVILQFKAVSLNFAIFFIYEVFFDVVSEFRNLFIRGHFELHIFKVLTLYAYPYTLQQQGYPWEIETFLVRIGKRKHKIRKKIKI